MLNLKGDAGNRWRGGRGVGQLHAVKQNFGMEVLVPRT